MRRWSTRAGSWWRSAGWVQPSPSSTAPCAARGYVHRVCALACLARTYEHVPGRSRVSVFLVSLTQSGATSSSTPQTADQENGAPAKRPRLAPGAALTALAGHL